MMVSFKTCLFYTRTQGFIPVYIINGRKQTLVNTIGILSSLRMRGSYDKRHLLAKLRICGSENCSGGELSGYDLNHPNHPSNKAP